MDISELRNLKPRTRRLTAYPMHEKSWKSKFNYYICYTGWLLFCIMLGTLLICFINDLTFIDGLFTAVSAVTSTGLSTVSMYDINWASFWVMIILIFSGGSLVLPLGPMLYRRYTYAKIKRAYPKDLVISTNAVINEFDLQDQALGVMIRTVIMYISGWIIGGGLLLYGGLFLQDIEPELKERQYDRSHNAAFLSVSAFNNAGYSLSSQSVEYIYDNPVAYLAICLLIVAGNTMAPIFYRFHIWFECRIRKKYGWYSAAHRFILDNPRRISTNTMATREVIFLFITTTALNALQYFFYLGSCLGRDDLLDEFKDRWTLAGMGFFQTISTRNAGLQIMNLQSMNQGMLLVYAIAMYLSGAPFMTALYASEDSQENEAKDSSKVIEDESDSNSEYEYEEYDVDEDDTSDSGDAAGASRDNGGNLGEGQSGKLKGRVSHHDDDSDSDEDENDDERYAQAKIDTGNMNRVESLTFTGTMASGETTQRKQSYSTVSADDEYNLSNDGKNSLELQERTGRGRIRSIDVDIAQFTMDTDTDASPTVTRKGESVNKEAPIAVQDLAPSMEELIAQASVSENGKKLDYQSLRRASLDAAGTKISLMSSQPVMKRGGSTGSILEKKKDKNTPPTSTKEKTNLTSGMKPKGWALLRQSSLTLVKQALFLEPDSNTMNKLARNTDVNEDYLRHKVMSGDVDGLASAVDNIPRKRKGKGSGGGSTKSLLGSDPPFTPPVPEPNMSMSYPSPLGRLSSVKAMMGVGGSHEDLHRHNSLEILNQRKFEIQSRFVESFIMKHSFFIGVGVFICAFSEDNYIQAHPDVMNLWYIIFEVISAYGNVGLSLSPPGQQFSLAGSFGFLGKLTLCLIMLLGKHRAMPKEKDAVIDFKFKRLKRAVNELGWNTPRKTIKDNIKRKDGSFRKDGSKSDKNFDVYKVVGEGGEKKNASSLIESMMSVGVSSPKVFPMPIPSNVLPSKMTATPVRIASGDANDLSGDSDGNGGFSKQEKVNLTESTHSISMKNY